MGLFVALNLLSFIPVATDDRVPFMDKFFYLGSQIFAGLHISFNSYLDDSYGYFQPVYKILHQMCVCLMILFTCFFAMDFQAKDKHSPNNWFLSSTNKLTP